MNKTQAKPSKFRRRRGLQKLFKTAREENSAEENNKEDEDETGDISDIL